MDDRDTVLVVSPLHPPTLAALERDYHVLRYWQAEDKPALLRQAAGVRAVVSAAGAGIRNDVIAALPNLQLIANFGVGLDAIDLDFARARGVAVTNTPDVLNDCVADLALGLILTVQRQLCVADAYVRTGRWTAQGPMKLGVSLSGKRCGIVGLGAIGLAIARRAQAFGLRIVYHNRRPRADVDYAYVGSIGELAAQSDLLVLALPGGPESRHIVGRAVLEQLGPNGVLINIARGSVVDEAALLDLLQLGKLGGAGLDVFEREPYPLPGLLTLENVVLAPHIGSATVETRAAMGNLVLDNVRAFFAGQRLVTPV